MWGSPEIKKSLNCYWGHFDRDFVWSPHEIKKIKLWFRVILTQVSCDAQHLKSQKSLCPWRFDTDFVWCPPEIKKIETVIEVILTQISCDVRPKSKKIEIVIGVILTQISWDVQYLKSQTSLSPWSFDTDFVWCPPGIKKRKLSLGSF